MLPMPDCPAEPEEPEDGDWVVPAVGGWLCEFPPDNAIATLTPSVMTAAITVPAAGARRFRRRPALLLPGARVFRLPVSDGVCGFTLSLRVIRGNAWTVRQLVKDARRYADMQTSLRIQGICCTNRIRCKQTRYPERIDPKRSCSVSTAGHAERIHVVDRHRLVAPAQDATRAEISQRVGDGSLPRPY